ncbi:hypothetical protein ACLB2K_074935 [Fragaria x ananassa]
MSMLVDCSNCLTPLQLPPGAQIIRCGLCDAVTRIAGASRSLTSPSPRQSPSSSSSHAPSPSSHAPPPPQSAHGRKRAVVCAVLYKRSRHELKGCINDAKCMKYLLVNKFKFPESSILMLTVLISRCIAKWLNGSKLNVNEMKFVYACHSGTVLDLPFLCRMDRNGRYIWEDHRPRSGVWKGTSGGEAISFSGCDDDQTSADTSALSKITSTGAMTYAFIQAIERGHATTYGNMMNAMRSTIRNTDSGAGGGIVTSLISMLLTGGSLGKLRQEPQLSANQQFDVYTKPFSL